MAETVRMPRSAPLPEGKERPSTQDRPIPRRFGANDPRYDKRPSKFGAGFWVLLFFALAKDATDFLLNLTVVLSPLTVITGFFMNMVVGLYFWYVGVRPTVAKVATFGVSFIIDVMPVTSFLPATTLNLLFIRYLENLDLRREK